MIASLALGPVLDGSVWESHIHMHEDDADLE